MVSFMVVVVWGLVFIVHSCEGMAALKLGLVSLFERGALNAFSDRHVFVLWQIALVVCFNALAQSLSLLITLSP